MIRIFYGIALIASVFSCTEDRLKYELTLDELRAIEECKSNSISSIEKFKVHAIGTWSLYGIWCRGLCEFEEYVQKDIFHLRENGTGFKCQGDRCHDFNWKFIQRSNGTIQLDVTPSNNYDDFTLFCENYMIYEYPDNTIIYRKL